MSSITIVAHQGTQFESQGSNGKFVKDVLREGLWFHPVTGQEVDMTRQRLEGATADTTRWLKNGNKIPFPDGHSYKSTENMGFWPGPFMIQNKQLYAVVDPKGKKAQEKIDDGSLDSVSVVLEKNVTDSEGNHYDEVITQICGTNYPVVTKQGAFVKLSRDGSDLDLAVLIPKPKDLKSPVQVALDRFATALQGKPGRTFAECVSIISKERGVDKTKAEAICATLARQAGEKLTVDRMAAAFKGASKKSK